MINIIPQSEVRLLNTPLEKDTEHTLNFTNMANQTAYFYSKTVASFNDFTYVKDNQTIVVGKPYDQIYTCNYLMYRNDGFNNKYFYAFITKMEYVSENSTRIYFEIDSLQTWYFQLNINNVYVEREHVSDDTIGLHTVPEGLETGEYVEASAMSKTNVMSDYFICFCVTKNMDGSSSVGNNLNGLFNGLGYYLLRGKDHGGGGSSEVTINTACKLMIYWYAIKNQLQQDDIYSIFLLPRGIVDETQLTWASYQIDSGTLPFYASKIEDNEVIKTIQTLSVNKPSTLAGSYTPKNNKLYTFPYRYLLASNNAGISVAYHYENFSTTSMSFQATGVVTPGCEIKLIPENYKNNSYNYNEGITFGKLPICAWTKDTYLNWQTQNSLNNNIAVAGGLFKSASAISTKNPGDVISGFTSILDTAKTVVEHEFSPNQAMGNTNCGDINFSKGYAEISLIHLSIKPEYARIIDNFFEKYGYKVNSLKVPNLNSRRYWNYIKTIECNFTGDIPEEDIEKIKYLFNRGITFWHDPSHYLDYSMSNTIVS